MSFEIFRDRCTVEFTRLAIEANPEEAIRLGVTPDSFPYRTLWYPPNEALLGK